MVFPFLFWNPFEMKLMFWRDSPLSFRNRCFSIETNHILMDFKHFESMIFIEGVTSIQWDWNILNRRFPPKRILRFKGFITFKNPIPFWNKTPISEGFQHLKSSLPSKIDLFASSILKVFWHLKCPFPYEIEPPFRKVSHIWNLVFFWKGVAFWKVWHISYSPNLLNCIVSEHFEYFRFWNFYNFSLFRAFATFCQMTI